MALVVDFVGTVANELIISSFCARTFHTTPAWSGK
jgi:hypothetical protein